MILYENMKPIEHVLLNPICVPTHLISGRNEGGQGGTSAPGRSTFGAPNWGRNVTYKLQNIKCQRMLIITIYKMLNVIAKSHRDHQGSHSEQLWTLMTFPGGVSIASNKRPFVVWLTAASQRFPEKQGCELFDFPTIVGSQWDGNPAFTVHAECYIAHAFRAAIKLIQYCYQGCAKGVWKRRRTQTSKALGYPKSEITKSAFYQNLVTRPDVQNFLWMLVTRSNF